MKGEKLATLDWWRRSIRGELDASYQGMATRGGYASEQLTVSGEIDQAKMCLKSPPEPEAPN
jgi:hypothetical protein